MDSKTRQKEREEQGSRSQKRKAVSNRRARDTFSGARSSSVEVGDLGGDVRGEWGRSSLLDLRCNLLEEGLPGHQSRSSRLAVSRAVELDTCNRSTYMRSIFADNAWT
jgi:hypothetical protein